MKKTFYAIAFMALFGLNAAAQSQEKVTLQTAPVSDEEVKKKREVVNADGTLSLEQAPAASEQGRNNATATQEKVAPAATPAPAEAPKPATNKKASSQTKQAPK
jgi:hypothetical protein